MKVKHVVIVVMAALCSVEIPAYAQSQTANRLSLEEARTLARAASPDLRAAQAAVDATRGRELQAGAVGNPGLTYSTEQTSSAGQSSSQRIAGLEQRLEIGGQRGSRRDAATARRRAAEAKLRGASAAVDFEVARAYAQVIGADRRARLARQAAAAFTEAGRVSASRLAAGDISGYTDRRLRLEGARYAALEAEAMLSSRAARIALSSLISASADSIQAVAAVLSDSIPVAIPPLSRAVLSATAHRNRADYLTASLEAEALSAESRLASRDRIPSPVLSAGYKTEKSAGNPESLDGFAAGISLPLPLFDRRRGAIQAAEAENRRAVAEMESAKRRVTREVAAAHDAMTAVEQQLAILAPQLGAPAATSLRSAQVAYSEGEIPLLEWLDAVRAYHEAESAYSNLVADLLVRRATLELVVASPLSALTDMQEITPGAAAHSQSPLPEND
ncbi:MAG: TolC family protein [Gemmatimonadaceae bacterium]